MYPAYTCPPFPLPAKPSLVIPLWLESLGAPYLELWVLRDLDSPSPASSLSLSCSSCAPAPSSPLAVLWTAPSLSISRTLYWLLLLLRTPPSVKLAPSHLVISAECHLLREAFLDHFLWRGTPSSQPFHSLPHFPLLFSPKPLTTLRNDLAYSCVCLLIVCHHPPLSRKLHMRAKTRSVPLPVVSPEASRACGGPQIFVKQIFGTYCGTYCVISPATSLLTGLTISCQLPLIPRSHCWPWPLYHTLGYQNCRHLFFKPPTLKGQVPGVVLGSNFTKSKETWFLPSKSF